jgi:hypothetical protein
MISEQGKRAADGIGTLLICRNLDPRCSTGLLYRAKHLILKASSFKARGNCSKKTFKTDSTANRLRAVTEAVNAACVITQKYLENKLCFQKMTYDSYGTAVYGY